MSKTEYYHRYQLIIEKLKRSPLSFPDLKDYLTLQSEITGETLDISKRTFQRDITEIRTLFNIDIQYNRSTAQYYIANKDQNQFNDRLLEAFDMFNVLKMSNDISQYLHFEPRRPQGLEHLHGILHAIKNHLAIRFTHHKFWDEDSTHRTVHPYALREFRSRWYLVALDTRDNYTKTFGLDRINQLEISTQKFTPSQTQDFNEKFNHSFGIISPVDQEPEKVVISFTVFQGKYIKSYPLHHSQQIVIDDENELRIELYIYITHDLIMELLSMSGELKIITPDHLSKSYRKKCAKGINRNKM